MNTQKPRRRALYILGALALAIVVLALVWDWNWFKPLVERQASNALGRPVTLQCFDVRLRPHPWIVAEGIVVANPPEFPAGSRLGSVERLAVQVNPWAWLHGRRLSLPAIEIDGARGELGPGPSGKPNYVFDKLQRREPAEPDAPPLALDLGTLAVADSDVHIVEPRFKADFRLKVRTEPRKDGGEPDLHVDIDGRYAGAPISGRFVGGSVLSLRDPRKPYPVDLKLRNGDTEAALAGTVVDPLRLGGARLKLDFRGNNMADLYALTGVPLPPSPPYRLTGRFDYADGAFRFREVDGSYGQSDIAGDVSVLPARGDARRRVTIVAHSNKVVWSDLSGFIGATPGAPDAKNDSAGQKAQRQARQKKGKLLPDTPIALPRIRAADLDVSYKVDRIESEYAPFDRLEGHLVLEDGLIRVQPLKLGVGEGSVVANIALDGRQDLIHTKADLDFRQLDFRKVMDKLTIFRGTGVMGGSAHLDAHGNSLAAMLGSGDGDFRLFMTGGDISALLVNLAGLDLGNSLVSALGLPRRAEMRCMVADFGLDDGQLDTRTMVVDTSEANVVGKGGVNLRDERIDYEIRTQPKRINVGSLATPIDVKGPLRSPSIRPEAGPLAVRGGAAVALGVLLTPLAALIPTIQLGLGEDNDCVALIHDAQRRTATAAPRSAAP
ncbi:AsmA family protein [Solimonas soli]|uniref:AsmA family protein n=1 Tax=Solimonas soli TaxID=413479 RepID=UPI0004BCC125|nr:AsmA family protein [Solimonas soli]